MTETMNMPRITTYNPSFSPRSLHVTDKPVGSRYEVVPHQGPGKAVYVQQPTRAELKNNNGLFAPANRPFYYRDPLGVPFIDIDGKECGPRWVYVDPRPEKMGDSTKCAIM